MIMYDESELVPASSTWRQPLELRGRKANIEGLTMDSVSFDNRLENVSCATLHNVMKCEIIYLSLCSLILSLPLLCITLISLYKDGNSVLVADTSRSRNVCKVISTVPSKSGTKISVRTNNNSKHNSNY